MQAAKDAWQSFPLHHLVLEVFINVGAWENIDHLEKSISLRELTYIIDTCRYKRHQDYDFQAQIMTGEGIGDYVSMTDIERTASSSDPGAISGFEASHLPIGLGYVSE